MLVWLTVNLAKYVYINSIKLFILCLLTIMCYNKIVIKADSNDAHCSIVPNTSLLIVNTLDGIIHAIDLNNGGKVLWNFDLGSPLLSSSLGRAEAIRNGVKIQVIPSLDGRLYQYDEEMVEALPFSASNLLKNSLHFSEDIVLIGGEFVSTYSLDLMTGQPYYACGVDGCEYFENKSTPNENIKDTICPLVSGSLLIKRISRMVKSVDSRYGTERWNFSVGDIELKFLKPIEEYQDFGKSRSHLNKAIHPPSGNEERRKLMEEEDDDENEEEEETIQNGGYLNQFGITVHVPEGVVTGFSDESTKSTNGHGSSMLNKFENNTFNRANEWHQGFTCPIAKVWSFINGQIQPLDLYGGQYVGALKALNANTNSPYGDPIYIGTYKGQLYVQAPHLPITSLAVPNPSWESHDAIDDDSIWPNGNLVDNYDKPNTQVTSYRHPIVFPASYWKPHLATSLTRTPPNNLALIGPSSGREPHHQNVENYYDPEEMDGEVQSSSSETPNPTTLVSNEMVGVESHALTTFRRYMDYPFDTGFYLWPLGGGRPATHRAPAVAPALPEEPSPLPTKSTRTHNNSYREACPARRPLKASSLFDPGSRVCPKVAKGFPRRSPEGYHVTPAYPSNPYFLYTLGGASFWFWWKEILLISLVLTVVMHVLLLNLSTRFQSPFFPWQHRKQLTTHEVGHLGTAGAIFERSHDAESRRYIDMVDRVGSTVPFSKRILMQPSFRAIFQWIITNLALGQIYLLVRSNSIQSSSKESSLRESGGALNNSSGYHTQSTHRTRTLSDNCNGTTKDMGINTSSAPRKTGSVEMVAPFEGSESERVRSNTMSLCSLSTTKPENAPEIFVSRFFTDFEPIRSLGRGGFGLVIQVRNRMDDQFYAIKRITLPNREESKQKVLREVRALAKLDNTNIVRYYQAWLECPPPEWDDRFQSRYLVDRSIAIRSRKRLTRNQLSDGHVSGHLTSFSDQWTSTTTTRGNSSDKFSSRHRTSSSLLDYVMAHPAPTSRSGAARQSYSESQVSSPSVTSPDDDDVIFLRTSGDEATPDAPPTPDPPKLKTKKRGHKPKLYLYIQMQLCQSKTLKDWLNSVTITRDETDDETRTQSDPDTIYMTVGERYSKAIQIFSQILDAVHYFHDRGLIHRDLKPSNIFFSMEGVVKIGDFGLATASVVTSSSSSQHHSLSTSSGSSQSEEFPRSFDSSRSEEAGIVDKDKLGRGNNFHQHTLQVGTRLYMSPEQIQNRTYTNKIDMYSLGLILFELLYSFSTQMERVKTLTKCRQQIFPADFIQSYPEESCMIKWLLAEDPNVRPDAKELKMNHLYKSMLAKILIPT